MLKRIHVLMFLALTVSFVYVNIARSDIVQKGLVAYWSLDANTISGKNVEDIVGENEGVLMGNPKEVAGRINEALEFDGTNSVDIEGTDALNFNGKEELSVCAWINSADDADPVVGVVAKPGGCCGTIVAQRDANGWALRYDGRNANQEFEFIVCPNWQGDGGFGIPKTKIKKGEWHYLVGVVNKRNMYLYLDGELANEGPFSGPITSTGTETEICHANADGGFTGIIDEVAIYDRALSEAEVKQNFQSKRFLAVSAYSKLATCWGKIKKQVLH